MDELYQKINPYLIKKLNTTYASFIKSQDFGDILNECWVQICKDYPRYDESKGELTTFVNFSIKNAIGEFFKTHSKPFKISEYERQMIVRISKVQKELPEGKKQDIGLIAFKLGKNPEKIKQIFALMEISAESFEGEQTEDGSREEFAFSSNYNLEESVILKEENNNLYQAISQLPEDQKKSILYAFRFIRGKNDEVCGTRNIAGVSQINYKDLAKYMNLSEEKSKQLVAKALSTLRKNAILKGLNPQFDAIVDDFSLDFIAKKKSAKENIDISFIRV